MPAKAVTDDARRIESRILTIRGQKVILDHDLATIYGVSTKRLNEQVKRNVRRFPEDFMFQLTTKELVSLTSQLAIANERLNRSQIATASQRHRDPRYRPYAFTEHGAVMAANILRSERAIQMSVFVVRAFVKMRMMLTTQKDLARKLANLEKALTKRLDLHERVISDIIQQIMSLLNPPAEPEAPRKQIGFHARQRLAKYKVGGKRVLP